MRIAGSVGREHRAHQDRLGPPSPNAKCAATLVISAVSTTPGRTRRPRLSDTLRRTPQREVQAAVEQDRGDPEREDQLGPERVERDVDDVERERADRRAEHHEHQHLGHPRRSASRREARPTASSTLTREDDLARHAGVSRSRSRSSAGGATSPGRSPAAGRSGRRRRAPPSPSCGGRRGAPRRRPRGRSAPAPPRDPRAPARWRPSPRTARISGPSRMRLVTSGRSRWSAFQARASSAMNRLEPLRRARRPGAARRRRSKRARARARSRRNARTAASKRGRLSPSS